VLTGLNEAFRDRCHYEDEADCRDTSSADLIKPFLAGRDIKRYQQPQSDKYLILMPRAGQERSGNAKMLGMAKENYPAIANYLLPFSEAAEKRYDKGEYCGNFEPAITMTS